MNFEVHCCNQAARDVPDQSKRANGMTNRNNLNLDRKAHCVKNGLTPEPFLQGPHPRPPSNENEHVSTPVGAKVGRTEDVAEEVDATLGKRKQRVDAPSDVSKDSSGST